MMFSVGTDIVAISRISEELAERILSEEEKKIYNSFKSVKRKKEFVAGRFAAKEAFIKAYGEKNLDFKKIEFLKDENGKPIPGEKLKKLLNDIELQVSISHEKEYAIAVVIVLRRDEK